MKAVKLPSGRWRARAYNSVTGERPSFTADTKKEAERLARMYTYSAKSDVSIRFEDAVDLYITSRERLLSVRTISTYRSYQKQYFGPLNKKEISRIDNAVLQKWVNDLSASRSPKYVDNIYTFAMSVMASVGSHKEFKITKPKVVKAKLSLPSEEAVGALINASRNTELYIPIILGAFACMRRGEIFALTDKDVNFARGEICINATMVINSGREWERKLPKNYEKRVIYPPAFVLAEIAKYGLTKLKNPDRLTVEFGRLLKRKCLSQMRFHDLRHFCAAKMLSANIPVSVVQEYGGWQEKRVLLDIYDYVIDEVRSRSMSKWDSAISDFTAHILPTDLKKP